jgi:hypothetical protein
MKAEAGKSTDQKAKDESVIAQVEQPRFHPSSFRLHPCSSTLL